MGQKPSFLGGSKINDLPSFKWIIYKRNRTTHYPNPEQPIKFQYKTRQKGKENKKTTNTSNNNQINKTKKSNQSYNGNNEKCRIIKTQNTPSRTKSEPTLIPDREKSRGKHRRRKRVKNNCDNNWQQFGYEIQDVDAFLTKATIEKPANIPVVLAFPSVLYQTRIGGYQAEISLPLGMVVNAVFKNQHWLYVQTPHAEEGYVSYAACLPLGIIPPPDDDKPAPCWEKSTDVFPKPSGNMTDTEKLSSKSDCGVDLRCRKRFSKNSINSCDEKSVDTLYLRAAAIAKKNQITRQTLLAINDDYFSGEKNILRVRKGEVVVLLGTHVRGWFWVRNKEGLEGFIPAVVAGHGFL